MRDRRERPLSRVADFAPIYDEMFARQANFSLADVAGMTLIYHKSPRRRPYLHLFVLMHVVARRGVRRPAVRGVIKTGAVIRVMSNVYCSSLRISSQVTVITTGTSGQEGE